MIYMDMSKAFDKVEHELLIQNLQKDYGFGGNLLRWFQCYLAERKQRVTVLGATSDLLPVTSDVPQGSILGPALLVLYINSPPNMSRSRKFSDCSAANRILKHCFGIFSDDDVCRSSWISHLFRKNFDKNTLFIHKIKVFLNCFQL